MSLLEGLTVNAFTNKNKIEIDVKIDCHVKIDFDRVLSRKISKIANIIIGFLTKLYFNFI